MRTQVIEGTAQQIAATMAHINGRVLQAILFVEETGDHSALPTGNNLTDIEFEQLIYEMEKHVVSVGGADYSREALYTPREGE